MISIVFKKLEQHSGEFAEPLKRLTTGDQNVGPESARREKGSSNKDGIKRNTEETKGEDLSANEQTLVTFTPEEQYAHVTMTFLVDNVCLHTAKLDEIKKGYK